MPLTKAKNTSKNIGFVAQLVLEQRRAFPFVLLCFVTKTNLTSICVHLTIGILEFLKSNERFNILDIGARF